MKRLAILGSTGSIGESTLAVVRANPERLRVVALAAGGNVDRVVQQAQEFAPTLVSVRDAALAGRLAGRLPAGCSVVCGREGLIEVALHADADMLVSALVGAVGVEPTHEAIRAGRDVALANKEALVVAGQEMTAVAMSTGARILPVDSEHNALHQCLAGEAPEAVRRLWLTASGGPFRGRSRESLEKVTREEALDHPTWKMGPKITIDSASLMNKGLEVIEARWLFDLPGERIRVVVHPQSVVHSMVEFVDGSFKAQLGVTDMRHPIQYALSWPERWGAEAMAFDPVATGPLTFEEPDRERFPCLALAYRALESGGVAPAVLNAANEVAVQAFLDGRARFVEIPSIIAATLDRHAGDRAEGIDAILAVDGQARRTARALLSQGVPL